MGKNEKVYVTNRKTYALHICTTYSIFLSITSPKYSSIVKLLGIEV